ncbi:hypothetical protein BH23CHL7_BH23CHL7_24890 [soil metagenome]|jgi:putative ABC transport system permease protein
MTLQAPRAILRIARRNIVRNRWRSVLVGLLIMLPVTGMVGAVTWIRTTEPTSETYSTWQIGAADFSVHPTSSDAAAATEQLRALLPPGTVIESRTYSDGVLVLPGRRVRLSVRSTNLEGLGRGTLDLVDGRLPNALDEAAISPTVASVAGVSLGDRVEVEGMGGSTVVGIAENPARLSDRMVLLHPALADHPFEAATREWLVALPEGASQPALGLMFEVSSCVGCRTSGDVTLGMLVFGALALIETVLVGAAAFAISIRRRQRELGLLAAAGGTRRQLAGTVLGEGLLVAGIAAALGLVAGIGLVMLASPWIDQLTDRRNPPLVIDFTAIGAACGVALLAGLCAAAAPAWTAARMPALVALSGRRPPASGARRTLILGIVLVAVSVAMTGFGASMLLLDSSDSGAPFLLVGGAILGVLGFGACSPWLAERLEWMGHRLPLVGRIALRDAARARSRTAPIVTATLAGLAAAIAVSSIVASTSSAYNAEWRPWARPDQLLLIGEDATRLGPAVAAQMSAVAGAAVPEIVRSDGSPGNLHVFVTRDGDAPLIRPDEEFVCSDCPNFWPGVAGPAFLAALGVPADARAVPPDSVLLLVDESFEARAATIVVEQFEEQGETPDGGILYTTRYSAVETLPARVAVVGAAAGGRFPTALLAAETAARLGFQAVEGYSGYVVRLNRPVTEADIAFAGSLLTDSERTFAEASFRPLDPNASARGIVTGLSVLLALTITAIAVALGESEARADQRALLAVGADPRLRRRIVAARAGVIALLAVVLAVPAGLLPVWGLFASRDQPVVVPLPEVLVIVAVLPLAAIAGALLLSRPIPAWSAFRDISET